MIKQKLWMLFTVACLGVTAVSAVGCPDNKGPAEKVGEKIDDTADDIEDGVEDALD